MEITKIKGYQSGLLEVYDQKALIEGDRCMLLRPQTGTVLGITSSLLEQIEQQAVSNDLAFLMVQRGLADFDQSREISDYSERIAPEFFLIDLTKTCNLACSYCFREFEENNPKMTVEGIDRICDSLIAYWKRNPSLHLSIQAWGGEPLLCLPLIVRIRERFSQAQLSPEIVMETNATLITRSVADCLRENQIHVGISIDGNAAVHDAQRPFGNGQGSLAKVEEGIRNLREAGVSGFGTITVVTKNTMVHLPEIMEYFAALSVRSVKFNMMRRNSRNLDLAPDPEAFEIYIRDLLFYLHHFYERRIPFVEQNISQRMLNLVHRPNNNICNAHGCHGGWRMLSVDAAGRVFPCELSDFEDYCIGTIAEDYMEMVSRAIVQKKEYFADRDLVVCSDCLWQYFCRGGCKSAVKYSTGNARGIDETECAFNKVLYPKLVSILLTDPDFSDYLISGEVRQTAGG